MRTTGELKIGLPVSQAVYKIAAAGALLVGCAGLAGWLTGTEVLKSVMPGWVSMKANTAVCLILCGVALPGYGAPAPGGRGAGWYLRTAAAAAVLLTGLLTLAEYGFKADLGIDQLLFREAAGAAQTAAAGRMAFFTALNFVLAALGILLLDFRVKLLFFSVSEILAGAVFLATFYSLNSFFYDLYFAAVRAGYTPMAPHAALAFLLLSAATVLARPQGGLVSLLRGGGSTRTLLLRLLPAALLLPPAFGWLQLLGQRLGVFNSNYGAALHSSLAAAVLLVVIVYAAKLVARDEAVLRLTQFSVDNATDAVFWTRPDGRFVYANIAMCTLLGRSAADLLARSAQDINNPALNELWAAQWAELRTRKKLSYETAYRAGDGELIPVEVNAIYLANGDQEYKCGYARDLREHRRLEAGLVEAKKAAEAASVAKSVFLSKMSHEIRTPMNAILGFSQLMRRDPQVTPEQRRQLDTINRSGEDLLELINEILELSRIEAGHIDLNSSAFNLHAMLEDLKTLFSARAAAKGLRLELDITGDLPSFAEGDKSKLRQALANLLGNAVKFTEKGGISLRVRHAPLDGGGFRFEAEVEDSGPGIEPEELKNLFQPFSQAQAGLKTAGGSGLGLALSREYARLMGGELSVSSRPGKGSVFKLSALLRTAEGAVPAASSPGGWVTGLKPGQPGQRVLIVDDKADSRAYLDGLLGLTGFETRQAGNGEEAVKEFLAWRPQLILMDLRMPVMDGKEAIKRVRADSRGREVKIIALSASVFSEKQIAAQNYGADAFMSKPFHEAELFETMGKCLGIEYLYEGSGATAPEPAADAPETQPFPGLDPALAEQVREAAVNCDFDRVLELADRAGAENPAAAAGLRALAKRFDARRILELLPEESAAQK